MINRQRVALVTGGRRGLGRAIGERLVQDGYEVVLVDCDPEVEATAREIGCCSVVADVTNTDEVAEMVKVASEFGSLAVLVNCAGINRDARLVNMTDDQWNAVIEVNLTAGFKCVRAVAPHMLEVGWGRIVNISSIGILGNRNTSNYAASKAGVVSFTRSAAMEFATSGVTVNAIAPGVMDTDMFRNIPSKITEPLVAKIPMRRIGQPKEIGSLVSFLASDEASYMTGQTIFLDGGLSLGYA